MKKALYGCLAVFVVLLAALAIYIFSPPSIKTFPELPVPNGYTNLLELALQIQGEAPESKQSDPVVMEVFGERNREVVKKIRSNLATKSAVPIEYTSDFAAQHLKEVSLIKRAAQALANEAKLCVASNRLEDAASIYLDVIKLGIHASAHGLLIDAMVGMACEQMGLQGLESIGTRFDQNLCQLVSQQIIQFQAQAATLEQIFNQEEDFMEQSGGWKGRLAKIAVYQSWQKMKQSITEKYQNRLRQKRLLLVRLASQHYFLDKKARPAKPEDLIPAYIKEMPLDPINGLPLPLSFFGD